jgi:ATP-binding cassette subfamily B protein
MEAGHIIERGNHAQLLQLNGGYAQMWALQQNTEASSDSTAT